MKLFKEQSAAGAKLANSLKSCFFGGSFVLYRTMIRRFYCANHSSAKTPQPRRVVQPRPSIQ